MQTIDRAQTVTDLRNAADVIERDGWHQGAYFQPEDGNGSGGCRVCASGAINTAVHGFAWPPIFDTSERERADAAWYAASTFADGPWGSIVLWNDEPGRTAEEVIAALRGAADKLEAEAAE